jgi:hypothetical protein
MPQLMGNEPILGLNIGQFKGAKCFSNIDVNLGY